ncbi:probable ATP-dependent RNA helicase DDX27 [Agrilus planipennis]|uniref:RNA helicase n=1 Tax=Agrilus planipennis TaxID=224129 RepID=A0A7F5RCZ6_AGRPL|nr:probable ATP-dependent RNA helicase DDX27 [Agrilus planipennis]
MTLNEMEFASRTIRTIDEGEEVENYSESSDEEVDFQPSKQKNKKRADFDTEFKFGDTNEDYNKDTWNDLGKYVKRKGSLKTDDRIKKVRANIKSSNGECEAENDIGKGTEKDDISFMNISDDELKNDNIKTKEKKGKKRKKDRIDQEEEFFEEVTKSSGDVSFYQMNLSRPLLKAITDMNFVNPTPIQAATVPVALMGRDICGCAATGTGKTAAYMLPTLERLMYRPAGEAPVTRVLVLVPTRELGVQVYQVTRQLSQHINLEIGLSVGGLDLKTQENVLRKNPDIIIATPGRLIDHIYSTPNFTLDSIEILILDEADRMLDEYFAEQMKEIINKCSRTHQTMLFSATMTDAVQDLASVSLKKPVKIFVDSNKQVAFNLRQEFVRIRANKETDREPILAALVCRTFHTNCMVFVQTKKQARRLHILLGLLGIRVGELHGNLTQPQRLEALEKFKKKEVDVLVATDVAARGLDIAGVETVINFVMPATLEHYIHRVGRTARAGRVGISVSLAGEKERKIVKDVVKKAKRPVKSRVIPSEIIDKYRTKLEKLEPEIERILQEEYEARLLAKTENQFNKVQNMMKGEKQEKRPWFQTQREKKNEKERLALVPANTTAKTINKGNRKKRKIVGENPEERINNEVNKVALLQARLSKRKSKPKKIRTCDNTQSLHQQSKKKKASNFTTDICDVSKKNTKMLRYEVKKHNKEKNRKQVNKQKGKAFGKPKAKKQKSKF